ncbi:MAG: ComEC/Rec2 family competence protein [Alkalibacterium sp.]
MRRKHKPRKASKSTLRPILLTTLLVSVAFLLGIWAERSGLSVQGLETYVKEVAEHIRSYRLSFVNDAGDEDIAQLHFFDVSQGASVLLEAYDGSTILIDTGRFDRSESEIITYLNEEVGVGGKIDLLIFTHNDADHIGNGDMVLEYFQVEEVWMNGMDHTSQTYSDLLDAMLSADVAYSEPKAGEIAEVGSFTIEVLHPLEDKQERTQNDESIVTRITIGETSFIHSGDVNTNVEERIIKGRTETLKSDIMALGHHGSRTSTSDAWLDAVSPSIAVYQAGVDNQYGHPHHETTEKFARRSAALFGTDTHGTIQVNVKQGNRLEIITEEGS